MKVTQVVLDSVLRLCKQYSQTLNWDTSDAQPEKDRDGQQGEERLIMNHVTNVAKCTIEKFSELGVVAANSGGSLVTILNASWKGVVTLLQLGNGALGVKVNVADIIATLISLINESLRSAAEAWFSSVKEAISVTEVRRIFVPVKFYLINAVKVSALFPSQAYIVYKDISVCILMISTFRILLSQEKLLNTASEVLLELLEKTSLDLLNSLLNSAVIKKELKFELLDWLFTEECQSNAMLTDQSSNYKTTIDEIYSMGCEALPRARVSLPGRVALFLSFLMYSSELEEYLKLVITRKLGWFLDLLTDEDMYSFILVAQIPVLYRSGQAVELVWEPLFSYILHALKTFMIVVSSGHAWEELVAFLLDHFFHPHFLCCQIVMELWCFLVSHAEIDLVNGIFHKFCALMKSVVSSESYLLPGSTIRKMARSICLLLSYSRKSMVDEVYNIVVGNEKSKYSSVAYLALLLEGFPINSLSDDVKSFAKQKIITDYFGFIESFEDKLLNTSSSVAFGAPIFALSSSLELL